MNMCPIAIGALPTEAAGSARTEEFTQLVEQAKCGSNEVSLASIDMDM